MSRSMTSRLLARSPLSCCWAAVPKPISIFSRNLNGTSARWEDTRSPVRPPPRVAARPNTESLLESLYGSSDAGTNKSSQSPAMAALSQNLFPDLGKTSIDTSTLSGGGRTQVKALEDDHEPYHLHVYSHKHNTHVTCTRPDRGPIISMSCGNIGFRKSRRGTFDAAYSLVKYVLERLIYTGWPPKINRLEFVLRGFGQGREAAIKVLMSPEGKVLRDKIVRVSDGTRIKFAGTRSQKKRRL
ncbi:hypothetical protein S40285_03752 [Stachybotrys chlorohalonatus IBT 40285]|uniref:Ribosomal protein S11 n=1 Tax=Stachybotrys chlorohalonatus (strain IBT 40285) TaxID=1283841 RepID=A0A084QIW5_STAC4|nr:hypothetical protein S40285_03752 [Stachybotrys chlorohalonata IBT 40285]